MLIDVKRKATDEDIYRWLATLPGFIEGLTNTRGEPTRLYDYQAKIISDRHPFVCIEKARQVGWSWSRALRALAQCHLIDVDVAVRAGCEGDPLAVGGEGGRRVDSALIV